MSECACESCRKHMRTEGSDVSSEKCRVLYANIIFAFIPRRMPTKTLTHPEVFPIQCGYVWLYCGRIIHRLGLGVVVMSALVVPLLLILLLLFGRAVPILTPKPQTARTVMRYRRSYGHPTASRSFREQWE